MTGLSLTTRGMIPIGGVCITTLGFICPPSEEFVPPPVVLIPVILDGRVTRPVPFLLGGEQKGFASLVVGDLKSSTLKLTGRVKESLGPIGIPDPEDP